MAFSRGLKTEQNDEVGVYVADIHNGDYIKLQNVDFSGNILAEGAENLPVEA